MSTHFTVEEVFSIAKKLEHKGATFYRLAAAACRDTTAAQVFVDLMNMENQHEQVFDALKDAACTADEEALDSPKWLAISAAILSNMDMDLVNRFKGQQDPQKILQEALGFEKDTIVFFLALKDMIPQESERSKIDCLIKEELGHVLLLGSQMAQAKVSQSPMPSLGIPPLGPQAS